MKRSSDGSIDARRPALAAYLSRGARYGLAGACALLALAALAQVRDTQSPDQSPGSRSANELKLGLPIDCAVGVACHILAYVDQDPGPGFRDFGGGRQTYDGHDGTDFAIADEAAMKRGVAVQAAAAGTVVRVRDGVPDKRVRNAQQAKDVSPIGCGNSVLIEHAERWRTYYCHMRNGSVSVKPGMSVKRGAVLGMVGSSGLASYPHVHLGVVHQGKAVDPFQVERQGQGGQPEYLSLWEEPVRYIPTGLIDTGFSERGVDIDTVWEGASSSAALTTQARALVFWAHPFGVLAGDVERLRLVDPDGKTANETVTTVRSANRINRVSSIALDNTREAPLRSGVWFGEYQLRRGTTLLIDNRRTITVEE